tara:strand:- start:200 stop:955 length:756 start_codon:yes stop_codon:yes gene_type:complete
MNSLISNKRIYGIIVCYNSAPAIEELYNRIDKTLFDKIFFFDDNSTDNSYEVAKKFDWTLIKNEKNLGHGGNLKKAMQTAFEDGADYAVEIHADNQYDPNSVKFAKEFFEKDFDLIIGSRFKKKNPFLRDGMPFLRYFTNKIMSTFTSLLLNIKLTEFHTGYKIFSRNFAQKVPYLNCSNNYLFSFQVLLQAKYFNLKYDEISISSSYEGFKTSCNYSNGFIYLIQNFREITNFILARANIKNNNVFPKKN